MALTHAEAEAFFMDNIRLAQKYARKHARVEEYDDLFQAASIGLWIAVLKYDPARGSKFSALAYGYMSNEVKSYLIAAGRMRRSGGTSNGKPSTKRVHHVIPRPISLTPFLERQ